MDFWSREQHEVGSLVRLALGQSHDSGSGTLPHAIFLLYAWPGYLVIERSGSAKYQADLASNPQTSIVGTNLGWRCLLNHPSLLYLTIVRDGGIGKW